jgi:hypothetical protein
VGGARVAGDDPGGASAPPATSRGGSVVREGGPATTSCERAPTRRFPPGCAKRCLPNSNTLYGGDGSDKLYGSHGPGALIGGPGYDVCHLGGHPKGSRDKVQGCEQVAR